MESAFLQRLAALDGRLRKLQERSAACDAVIAERRTRASTRGKEVAEAKHRLGLQPDVQKFMIALQTRVHQRGVGLYEKLLTALVQDVLPENPHPVSLELSTDKGLPALTIQLGSGDTAQDIYHDTGGSLTNVVSSGLRFVALARSPLRKFLVLDEPDCWIEPFRIPRFADILASMATEVGVQAILISHHADSAFDSIPDRMRLEKDGDRILVRSSHTPQWEASAQPGIRSIRLERFMSHRDTTLNLGPGINVLSGPNHIGKSAIVSALRVLAYHEGADRNIMHGCDDFCITITMEHGRVIKCQRFRKGKRKTVYSYFEPGMDKPREEPASKTELPDFVHEKLNIQRMNDLDIQLSHQKMPVFMLNEPKTKQATLLSAGMEADHVRQMLERYKKWNDADRATVRNGEKELTELTAALNAWDEMFAGGSLSDSGRTLDDQRQELGERLTNLDRMQQLAASWARHEKMAQARVERTEVQVPVLTPVEPMMKAAFRWQRAERVRQIKIETASPTPPTLHLIDPLLKKGRSWQKAVKRAQALAEAVKAFPKRETLLYVDAPPELRSGPLMVNLKRWREASDQVESKARDLVQVRLEKAEAEAEKTAVLALLGDMCPLCEQQWPHAHNRNKDELEKAA